MNLAFVIFNFFFVLITLMMFYFNSWGNEAGNYLTSLLAFIVSPFLTILSALFFKFFSVSDSLVFKEGKYTISFLFAVCCTGYLLWKLIIFKYGIHVFDTKDKK